MQKKTILIFIDWFTPGYKAGGPVRSNANLIAHCYNDFHFKVVTRNTEYMETIPYTEIEPNTWVDGKGFKGFYFSSNTLSAGRLKNLIRDTPCDSGYVNGIYSLYFSVLPVFFLKRYRKKVVISARGMLSPHALAVKGIRKKLFLFVARTLGLYRGVTFHATNEEEAGYIRNAIGRNAIVHVAPNLPKPATAEPSVKPKLPGEIKLIYIGRVAPEKNTLFAIEVLKELGNKQHKTIGFDQAQPPTSNHHPQTSNLEPRLTNPPTPLKGDLKPMESEAIESSNLEPGTSNFELRTGNLQIQTTLSLSIYGSIYDTAYWNECEKLIAQLPENIQVNYCGSVEPETISEVLTQHHFLFQPSKGENYGHTIAESFQNGIPVIISDRTPWRGLQAVDSIQAIVDSQQFIDTNPNRASELTEGKPEPPSTPEIFESLNCEIKKFSIGWDLPLEQPQQFVEAIEYCARMNQQEYNAMSQRAFIYAQSVFNDPAVLEANRKLFEK